MARVVAFFGALTSVKAVLSGVANPIILGDQLDVLVSHEGMRSAGCGLGSAGFIVLAHPSDMVAVAAGVARFLSVESCGQCTPCKIDGTEVTALLDRLARSNATAADLDLIEHRIGSLDYGARCYLATQQATMLTSVFNQFRDEVRAHLTGDLPPAEPVLVAELLDIRDEGAITDERPPLQAARLELPRKGVRLNTGGAEESVPRSSTAVVSPWSVTD